MAHALSDSLKLQLSKESPPEYEEAETRPKPAPRSSSSTPRTNRSLEILDEQSPLLSPKQSSDGEGDAGRGAAPQADSLEWNEGDGQETKSVWYLILLTLGIGGLQIAWSVELSNGSPYLLSLGMTKALLALVWIAGPISGTIVQPYVGIRSDNCRVSWGKRKPFMLAGASATILSLMALAWTREIVHGILGSFGADVESHGVKVVTITFAIVFVYILDFAINTVQAGVRAFIVDNAPTHQQEAANAWAGRITGVGNILGYLSGYVNLPRIVPIFGNTQFKVLCVIASFALGSTVTISCLFIHERDPRLEGVPSSQVGLRSFFRQVFKSMKRLPPQIRKVCEVQFFNWIGWFPFLFYITTYIGQIYVNPIFAENPDLSPAEIDAAWESATRVGTFALLVFAITSFVSNILLPFIIVPTYRAPQVRPIDSFHSSGMHHARPSTPGTPCTMSASMTSFFPVTNPDTHSRLARLLSTLQIPWLTLRRAWLLSHLLFAACMVFTFFVTSIEGATALVGLVGLAWALTLWAPFALISAEISKRDADARVRRRRRDVYRANNGDNNYDNEDDAKGSEDQAGVILGLHNVSIASPQIIATLVSSAIFRAAQRPRGTAGDNSVAWVLRFGGCAALVAAYMVTRIAEERDEGKENDGDAVGVV
ncbi:MAG: sucrose transporter [Lasallia pustulata]|uniref:Sucrose transporter n=1 Tax=Lasallia pustulata TaxID=136370 RepID=A0A5M8PR55_9LECA|nr:MAG: sucrose transporter [Lasallia pustulata]